MSARPDFVHKKYSSMRQKTLQNALAQRLRREFPRLGGDRNLNLCAEMILEVVESHIRPSLLLDMARWSGWPSVVMIHRAVENASPIPISSRLSSIKYRRGH